MLNGWDSQTQAVTLFPVRSLRRRHVLNHPGQITGRRCRSEWKPLPILICDELQSACVLPLMRLGMPVSKGKVAGAVVE
jgi:hypothetical protein